MSLTRRSNNNIQNEFYTTLNLNQSKVIEDDGTYFYICKAGSGTATSAAEWQIKRITQATGDVLWADGDSEYDNVQDNYATLSYS